MQLIADWLEQLGMSEYAARFAENRIDFSVLPDLTDQDLEKLGVLLGDRRKMLRAIANLDNTPAAPPRAAASAPSLTVTPLPEAAGAGERRYLTVMFCDLADSTGIAARLDAEEWRDLVSSYLDAATAAVTEMRGHVAKKLGDGLMALFGYPVAHENDAERAARAALAIQRALAELNRKNEGAGKPVLAARIGLETGTAVVDAAGEIYGDVANVAARVQVLAEPGAVLVTSRVQRQVAGLFVAEERGIHALKGVPEPTALYRLVRASGGGRRSGQRQLTPLVGRDDEMTMLLRRWERARQGDGQLVMIVGEPGLGKSRLIEEFHNRLRETPHTWVEWSCSQLLQNTPLHPIAEWGRARFGGADVPAERRLTELESALAQVKLDPGENVSLLAPLLDIPLPQARTPALAPEELRRRQLAALTNWVMASAKVQPIVLAFEDLHWADPTTLDVLRGIAERGALAPLFIVATTRPEFRAPWGMRSHHGTISLAPLDRAQVRDMVAELSARHALPRDVVEDVAARTSGVPLFVEEVTRLLLERGEHGGGIEAIPPTLQQSLMARLDRLGPAREVAQVGSVIGRGFSYGLLRSLAGMEDTALQAALEKLADADIVLVQGLPPESDYRFKHALIQDAAYENLLKSRRQVLHRRVAEILRDRFAATAVAEPELLAHHFTQAGLTEAAVEWWGTAGHRSLARSALVEATEQLKRALEQIATLPATPALRREEIKLEIAFANVLSLTGDLVDGKEHYDRALAIYDPAEHGTLKTRSSRDVEVTLLSYRSSCVWQLGYPAASRNDAERAVKNAREIGHATTLAYALSRAANSYTFCGNYAAAHAQVDELIALADEKGKAVGTALRGRLFALTGNASDAVRAITSGITSLRSTGATLYEPWHLWHLAMSYTEIGQPDDALRCIDDALDKVERSKERWCEAEVNRVAGEVALRSPAPDTEKAEKYFGRALAVARRQQAKSWELRAAMSMARLWRDQGKTQQARELLAPVYGWFSEGFDTLDLKEAKALLNELRA
jgi:class 3 adenylate cyclase/predicted ATPase